MLGRPSSRKKPRVMENDNAIVNDVRTPVIPILLHGLFPVISVNQQKIDRPLPTACCIMAKGLDPDNSRTPFDGHRAMSRTPQEVKHWRSGKMKRIHEIQHTFGIHGGPQRDCRSALGHADFHKAPAPARVLLQRAVLGLRVLRHRRTQSGPGEKWMPRRPGNPAFGARLGSVNVSKSNLCFRHVDVRLS